MLGSVLGGEEEWIGEFVVVFVVGEETLDEVELGVCGGEIAGLALCLEGDMGEGVPGLKVYRAD